MVRDYLPEGYPDDHAMVPHGLSVILNAPAVFRFTGSASPERHLYGAALMGVDVRNTSPEAAGRVLADALIDLMRRLGVPNGLGGVGLGAADVDSLVKGTLPQHRVTKLSPRPFTPGELRAMFADAMKYW
jgi:hydroxyacid-oxoacid transhydrogenase